MNYLADLELALQLADVADEITMERFLAADLRVETKPDLTPVSDADRSCEQALRQLLAEKRPADGVLGEEFGSAGTQQRRWVIDPIDGTKNFVRGVPVWATLIGLSVSDLEGSQMAVGVVSAPALGRRWWASKGEGAYCAFGDSVRRLSVSQVSNWKDASFSYSSLTGWQERGVLPAFLDLATTCWRSRAYGDFWSYMLVAEGVVDAAAEPELELYDMAALVPIVEEAGGVFTSWEGNAGPWGKDAVASNGCLHCHLLEKLS